MTLVKLLSSLGFFLTLWCCCYLHGASNAIEPIVVNLTWASDPMTTMIVQWITHSDVIDSAIQYKEEANRQWKGAQGHAHRTPEGYPFLIHRQELTDLQPDTTYAFRFRDGGRQYHFRTLPKSLTRHVSFIVGGDVYQDDLSYVRKVNKAGAARNPDFALIGGDIIYRGSYFDLFPNRFSRWIEWLKAWQEDMVTADGRLIPMLWAIGNHDVIGGFGQSNQQAPYFYALSTMAGLQGYSLFTAGDYLGLVILDSGHTHPIEGMQTRWLEGALKQCEKAIHKFALYHVPAYPSVRGYHNPTSSDIRKHWSPLFDQYNVDAAFEHHDHAYKRTHPIKEGKINPNGVLYLGDGCWGVRKPRKPKTPGNTWYLSHTDSRRHIFCVTLEKEKISFEAVDENGNTFDTFFRIGQE